jgi:YVTN family beta-propeller protein
MRIRSLARMVFASVLLFAATATATALAAQSTAPGGGNRLLMTTYWGDDIVALLDIQAPAGKEELWRIDVAKAAGCLKPYDVRLNKGGSLALVSCSGTNLIIAIDVPAQQVQYVIETGLAPRDLVLFDNDRRLLVANSGSDTVSVLDLVNRRKLYDFPVAVQPYGVAVTDAGKTALVTGWASGDLHIFSLGAEAATSRAVVDVGLLPYTVVAPRGSTSAFVAINADDKVVKVDLNAGKIESSIPVGRGPWSLASSMDGQRVLVTNNRSNSLSLIDPSATGADGVQAASFTAGSQHRSGDKIIERRPKNAAIGSDGSVAAFTELAGDQIVIVELPSGKIVRAIDGGKAPYGIEFLR